MAAPGVVLMDIVKRVREINENLKKVDHPIPTSDVIYRKNLADIVSSKEQATEYLARLVDAHYLLPVSIVEPDNNLMIEGIVGYVVSEIPILKNLRDFANRDLEVAYEQHFYRRKNAIQIIREMLPQARNFNNTALGRCLNIAMMVHQYEQVMATNFAEYTDGWKRRKIEEMMPGLLMPAETPPATASPPAPAGIEDESPAFGAPTSDFEDPPASATTTAPTRPAEQPARAVDSAELQKIQEMDRSGQWGKAVDRYGTQFLLRIHFRKYEFDKVRWLLRTGKVATEEDLRFVRDTLRLMETRTAQDTRLLHFLKEMAEIRRLAQVKLNAIHQVRKKG